MELYFDQRTRKIIDGSGDFISLDKAKKYWEAGRVDNWNMSLERLANNNFDMARFDIDTQRVIKNEVNK